jgi:hypothetical protein
MSQLNTINQSGLLNSNLNDDNNNNYIRRFVNLTPVATGELSVNSTSTSFSSSPLQPVSYSSSFSSSLSFTRSSHVAENNFLNDQITSLNQFQMLDISNNNANNNSGINSNTNKRVVIHNQINRTSSTPVVTRTATAHTQLTDDLVKQINLKKINEKHAHTIGNYLLFEPQTINDTFGTAFNIKSNKYFYWKVNFFIVHCKINI